MILGVCQCAGHDATLVPATVLTVAMCGVWMALRGGGKMKGRVTSLVFLSAIVLVVVVVAWVRSGGLGAGATTVDRTGEASPPSGADGAAAGPKGDVRPDSPEPASVGEAAPAATQPGARLPRVVDVGADKCIPCKQMAPILVELRKEYEGRVIVEFVDVWKNPRAGEPYRIRMIPTQIFFDADGREVWRHEGFLPKADFIAKFAELGVK